MEYFFVSDLHVDHFNIMKFCNRPFNTVEEMNEILIQNWNSVVGPHDYVYHLGDFGFGTPTKLNEIFKRLHGVKMNITGNHDGKVVKNLPWAWQKEQYGFKMDNRYIWLNHYPMRSWNRSYHGAGHLHGHVHGRCKPYGKSFDIGVDSWDYTPVNFETIKLIMDRLPTQNPEFDGLFYQDGEELFNGKKLLESI